MVEEDTQYSAHFEGNPLPMSSDILRAVLTSQQLYEAFARNLKEFRKARGFKSANALAVMIPGMSPNTIRAWERLHLSRGRTYPRLDALERVAEKLNCEIWELFHPDVQQLRRDLAELKRFRDAYEEGRKQ